jgi:hypothetical protein
VILGKLDNALLRPDALPDPIAQHESTIKDRHGGLFSGNEAELPCHAISHADEDGGIASVWNDSVSGGDHAEGSAQHFERWAKDRRKANMTST